MEKKKDGGFDVIDAALLVTNPLLAIARGGSKIVQRTKDIVEEESLKNERRIKMNDFEDAYNKKEYGKALEILESNKDSWNDYFYYYYYSGMCHWFLSREDENYEDIRRLEEQAAADFRQALDYKDGASEKQLTEIYYNLSSSSSANPFDKRRYLLASASMQSEYRKEASKEYNELSQKLKDEDSKESQCFKNVEYSKRQFLFVSSSLATGSFDDDLQCVFAIDELPAIVKFSKHPQPNTLYYAHPARNWYYLPFEGAEDALFNDKVRDFCRLVQCLGATEIKFESLKGRVVEEETATDMTIGAEGNYKVVKASVEYQRKKGRTKGNISKDQKQMVLQFSPTKAPYVPDDISWLSVDQEWQSLVNQRREGNMLQYKIRISSYKTMNLSTSRVDSVHASCENLVAKVKGNYSKQRQGKFHREEETEWEISVTFKSLEDLPSMMDEVRMERGIDDHRSVAEISSYTEGEIEYLNEYKEMVADGEISERDRRFLNKIMNANGITPERAKELEASLAAPSLTKEEQEYLDEYREIIAEGTISPRDQRYLDKLKQTNGISESRAEELEAMA